MTLRDYQDGMVVETDGAWCAGYDNVLIVCPTGGGKTRTFSHIVRCHTGVACVIAHRQELVAQISLALGLEGVVHNIVAPKPVIRRIVALHMRILGRSWYQATAQTSVAGVDTLVRRVKELERWRHSVTLWVQDEAHHVLADNKWGTAAAMFPNAKGLGVTATPDRADGKGLGRHADGLFDYMVLGPSLRDMIGLGWLTDYRILAPPSDFVVDDTMIGSTGDYSQKKMSAAAKKSHIVGDVVEHFLAHAAGSKGVTFYPDVETATQGARAFTDGGVPAMAVSAKTDDTVRAEAVLRLTSGELSNLTNVDIFGEGFDLPAIDVVSMARPTASFALFCQQAGRALRPVFRKGAPLDTPEQRLDAIATGPKPSALILDHVENVRRHAVSVNGVIDICNREWTLDRRERKTKKASADAIPLTMCVNDGCFQYYEATKPYCPYCHTKPEPAGRAAPEQVDGDLCELDPSSLQQITQEIAKVDGPVRVPAGASRVAALSIHRRHQERQDAQGLLRDSIAWWAAWEREAGRSQSESYRRFYHFFGVDVATAQTLGKTDAAKLNERIALKIMEYSGL